VARRDPRDSRPYQTGAVAMFRSAGANDQRPVAGAAAVASELPLIRLREVEEADAEFLAGLQASVADNEWDGYDDPPEDMLSGGTYGGGSAIVELSDSTSVGSVSWIQVPHGPNRPSLAWCIGITVSPLFRGQRIGAAAQRLLYETLFRTSQANRVEAETDVDNIAERRSLELAGFTLEGIARRANWRRGDWHDMAVYSRLRSDAP
jgi:RimJ/RimL family protein N-acetyltransferase